MSYKITTVFAIAIVIGSSAMAGSAPRISGPMVFTHDEGGYIGIANDDLLEAHALSGRPVQNLTELLSDPKLAHVTMPADGFDGPIVDQQGRCLSNDELASSPTWLPCSARFKGQTWRHASGLLTSIDPEEGREGRLGFWSGMSARGTLVIEGGDTTMTLLASVFKPATTASSRP